MEEIEDYKLPYVYENLSKRIIHGRVSAKIIRKWHMNFLVVDHEVEEAAANFIQGRAPATVGSAHYLNKTKKADKEYRKVIKDFPI